MKPLRGKRMGPRSRPAGLSPARPGTRRRPDFSRLRAGATGVADGELPSRSAREGRTFRGESATTGPEAASSRRWKVTAAGFARPRSLQPRSRRPPAGPRKTRPGRVRLPLSGGRPEEARPSTPVAGRTDSSVRCRRHRCSTAGASDSEPRSDAPGQWRTVGTPSDPS